ncbi:MAG: aminoglycoside phosphotransferase family protein [Gammaproteobacteria bacterium]
MTGIPERAEDLDAGWLTAALASRYPEVVVTSAVHLQVVHGAATKVKLALTYNPAGEAAGLPRLLWAKSGWEPHSQWLTSTSAIDAREARFYRDFAAATGFNTPRCFHADFDAGGRGIVLIEDLPARGARLGDARTAATPDEVAAMLDNLARLHARWWDTPDAPEVRMLDRPMRRGTPSTEWPLRNGPEVIARYLATARGDRVPQAVKNHPERIDAGFWAMIDDMSASTGGVVLHGDAHPGNSFFDADGSPGFYDWQTLSFGPWGHDVAYYIASALDVDERRRSDRALLRHYLGALRSLGVRDPPGFDAAWLVMRRYIAYGLHIWISNPDHFQPEAVCVEMTTRLAAAAEDYDFFGAWGV